MASDNRNENHTTVVIHVKDVNDNPPLFDRPLYETQITEEDDRSLPKNILQVSTVYKISLPQSHNVLHSLISIFWLDVLMHCPTHPRSSVLIVSISFLCNFAVMVVSTFIWVC